MRFVFLVLWTLILIPVFLTSCATHSQSRWAVMAVAAPVGAGLGALSSPENEKPIFHAFAWGSAFVAAAAIIGNYYYNDDPEIKKLRQELIKLKSIPKFELITEGKGYFNDPLKGVEIPVKWRVYKVDKWISGGEGVKYHQDLMIKREEKGE